ncbi:Na+/H+ antiporter subunit A [Paenibacillus sp. WLX1005]|uniref:Na+/H+ antiporter subunit A n=1 Tax=Paenibacillus sp. WLX1005 TaxID=3243766 RepID=UPI003984579D
MYVLHAAILAPFVLAVLVPLIRKYIKSVHTGWFVLMLPVLLFTLFLTYLPVIRSGDTGVMTLPWMPSLGIDFAVYVDGLGLLFALLITGIGALVVLYSIYYLDPEQEAIHRFYLYLLMFMGAMLGIVLSDNMIVLYTFWELTSISSFLLIAFWYERDRSRYGALKSMLITVFGGFAMLAGFVLLHGMTDTWSIRETIAALSQIQDHPQFMLAMILVLLGAFTKSAQFPFHIWLPDAMEAPTPVSAYLHSATMVKAGIYLVARFSPIFAGEAEWFWIVSLGGIITMCYGSMMAVRQNDLKALLAYSTISQLGLIMSLFGAGSVAVHLGYGEESLLYAGATTAAIFHLINHATFKGALFMVAGIVDHETGTRDMRKLGGLMNLLPITFTISCIGAFSMAGLPPFNGFLSKEMFLEAMVELTHADLFSLSTWGIVFPILAFVGSVFTFVYCMVLVFKTFRGPYDPEQYDTKPHEPSWGMLLPPAILALLVLVFGFVPNLLSYSLIEPAMRSVLPGLVPESGHYEVHISFWHGFTPALWMTVGIILLGTLLYVLLPRWEHVYRWYPAKFTLTRLYDGLLHYGERLSRGITLRYMNGSVHHYLVYIFGFIIVLIAVGLFRADGISLSLDNAAPTSIYEIILIILLVGSAVAVPFARQRLTAVIMTGAVGYLVTLFFVFFRAPDLALTQMIVETVSVVLFLLCFYHMPELRREVTTKVSRWLNTIIAIGVGVIMTLVSLAASGSSSFDSIASYFVENSHDLGGGDNVVNVILVDFRGFDTFLEITVLSIAALGIFSMIQLQMKVRDTGARILYVKPKIELAPSVPIGRTRKETRTISENMNLFKSNDVILATGTKVIVFIILTFALYLFFAGHNNPGGGFIGGLMAASALILLALAFNVELARRVVPIDYRDLIATGLGIAYLTGIGSFLFGMPFLSHTFAYVELPFLGKTELATAMIFDLGVFLTVIGVTMIIILQIGEDR